jgi:putative NIF3 family GTP cyclohydrolase 1 type 2
MTRLSRLSTSAALLLLVSAHPAHAQQQQQRLTARQIIERIQARLGGDRTTGVDNFKDGDPDTPVSGVAVTMMATMDVLQRAVAAGANLIITHEPTFYGHLDQLGTLEAEHDAVTAAKRAFIAEHHLVIWRLHDHWHFPARNPDPVVVGVFRALGWDQYARTAPDVPVVVLPETVTVAQLASRIRARLGIRTLRVVGDSTMRVTHAAFVPGFPGFDLQRHMLQREDVDVLVMGEAHEWETIEYAADAAAEGRHKAIIVLGHVPSEEAGSEELARWLTPLLPEVRVTHIVTPEPFWPAR